MSSDATVSERYLGSSRSSPEANTYGTLAMRPLPEISGYTSVLELWDRKRGANLMPNRADFAFEDFAGWHGSISISIVQDGDIYFTLYGSRFVEILGVDLTHKYLCEAIDESLVAETKQHFKDLISGPHIGHTSGFAPTTNRDFIPFDVLDLPLSDNDRDVTQFLHALRKSDRHPATFDH